MKTEYHPDGPDTGAVPAGAEATLRVESKAKTYAASLFSLAKAEGRIGEVDQDLQLVLATVRDHLKLKDSLRRPELPVDRKQAIVAEVFGGKVSPLTLSYIQLLVGVGMTDALTVLGDEYTALVEAEERKLVAEVATAVPLDKEFVAKLSARLSAMTGKDVKVRHRVDPSILGGIVVRMGGRLLDGSLKHQLEVLQEKMSNKEMRGGKAKDAAATD